MRIILFYILLAQIACSSSPGNTSTNSNNVHSKTPNDIGKELFQCIKNNDFSCLSEHIVTQDEVKESLLNTPSMTKEDRTKVLESLEQRITILHDELKSDVNSSNFDGYVYDTCIYIIATDPDGINTISDFMIKAQSENDYKIIVIHKMLEVNNRWALMTGFDHY